MAQELIKRSAETVPFGFDVSGFLPAGVTVTSVQSVAPDQVTTPPLVFSDFTISTAPIYFPDTGTSAPAGTVVTFTATGGVPTALNTPYLVRMLYTASDGSQPEAIGYLAVIDNPPIEWPQY
jgi:hypothetical protein